MRISRARSALLGKIYDDARRRAGRGGAGGSRAPSLDREIHRHQIRASFRGRRSAAGPGGAAARCLPQDRRRPQGAGDGAGGFRRGLEGAADQDALALRIPGRDRPAAGAAFPNDPGRYLGGLNLLGQPLWSPAGPNGFPDTNAAWAAPEGMKLRLDISAQIASRLADNVDPRDLLELVAADAASPETRRTIERAEIAAAGAGAVADVAGIPEEMTPWIAAKARTSSHPVAARAVARRRVVRGLGVFAEIRARRRRPRSAADRRHPARRAGWARDRRADSAIPIMPACMVRSR